MLVTGASGFVGAALCKELAQRGHQVRGAVRGNPGAQHVSVGMIGAATDWRLALVGCDVVVHLAARVHVMSDASGDPIAAYREVNVEGTLNLARQASELGVRRFVFVSSVKVNGEATAGGAKFSAVDVPAPCDPYGVSKMEAEQGLLRLAQETGLEVVIVRPPLVYGPGVKANFRNLIKLVKTGLPLPFANARGRRSMVALDNLIDLLILCTSHRSAPGRVLMVSDGVDVTLVELVCMISRSMGKPLRLLPIPIVIMQVFARLLGKSAVAHRLFGSLQIDIAQTEALLEWRPIVSPQAAIDKTVAYFLKTERTHHEKNS